MSQDTRDLVSRASRGDAVAVDSLLERNLPRLKAYIRLKAGPTLTLRESVSDLVQSVCREVLVDQGDFEYRNEESFRAWLFQQAYRKIVDRSRYHAAEKRSLRREEADADIEACLDLLTPSRGAEARERLERIEALMLDLPEDQREAILLQRVAGLPYSEIAAQLGRSEGATRNLVYRGLARIAAELSQRG